MRTNVYVDGFNLYYRAVRGTRYKWLDLGTLCRRLLPQHEVHRIRYFTANVTPRLNDPDTATRQQVYLRALQSISNLSIHFGQFRQRKKVRPLAVSPPNALQYVEILDTEEKGSDVNLATYLLVDGFEGDYEQALVISNDSDLALSVRLVRERLHRPVGVVNPNLDAKYQMPVELLQAATFVRRLRAKALAQAQFSAALVDDNGAFAKPATW